MNNLYFSDIAPRWQSYFLSMNCWLQDSCSYGRPGRHKADLVGHCSCNGESCLRSQAEPEAFLSIPFLSYFAFLEPMDSSFFSFLQTVLSVGRDILCQPVFTSGHTSPFWKMFGIATGPLRLASAFVLLEGSGSSKARLKELCLLLLGDTTW